MISGHQLQIVHLFIIIIFKKGNVWTKSSLSDRTQGIYNQSYAKHKTSSNLKCGIIRRVCACRSMQTISNISCEQNNLNTDKPEMSTNKKGRHHLEDLSVNERMLLKCCLKKLCTQVMITSLCTCHNLRYFTVHFHLTWSNFWLHTAQSSLEVHYCLAN